MPNEQNTRNPEPRELVGSKDLRETFKEFHRVRGSWFINNIEMHQFEANSPGSVVSQINAKSGSHFVTAEIDDGGHLVLIDKSGADIMVREGAPFFEAAPASTGDTVKDMMAASEHVERKRRRHEEKEPSILEMLGLEGAAKEVENQPAAVQPGFETGRSAEQRKKDREREAGIGSSGTPVNPNQPAQSTAPKGFDEAQQPSNPTPGDTGGAGGKLADGRGRTGTGGGSGETSAATVQKTHQQPSNAPVPGA